MSVKKIGSSWQVYVSVTRDGRIQKYRKNLSSKEDAEILEPLARKALREGKPVPVMESKSSITTLGEASQRCYLLHWKGGKSEEKQIQIMKLLNDYFGRHCEISKITTLVIDDFILYLKTLNNSGGTINRKLATLSKILRTASQGGLLSTMPTIRRQKEGQNRIRWLTKEEEDLILDTLDKWGQEDMKDGVVVSVDTGVRASELLRIKSSDISKEGLYLGETKNGINRLIPLTGRSRSILESRQKATNQKRLFDFKENWYRDTWDKMRHHLDMEDVVWHTLRHTTASRLVQGGVPLTHVKEWMGHLTISTTMRYAHLAPRDLQNAVSVLE